jgi:AcrR family transcriptional regulator
MARPKVPLISRRQALEAALDIVDREGLKALSIRRLGDALNVNGASLYHHFKNKDEILVGVAQLALADVTSPRVESDSWRVWLPLNTYRTREALIRHPELIPIMLRRGPMGIGQAEVEASVERMIEEGVSTPLILPLMESLELLAISSALQEVGFQGLGEEEQRNIVPTPALDRASRERGMTPKEVFEVAVNSMISIVESAVQLRETHKAITEDSTATSGRARPA